MSIHGDAATIVPIQQTWRLAEAYLEPYRYYLPPGLARLVGGPAHHHVGTDFLILFRLWTVLISQVWLWLC